MLLALEATGRPYIRSYFGLVHKIIPDPLNCKLRFRRHNADVMQVGGDLHKEVLRSITRLFSNQH